MKFSYSKILSFYTLLFDAMIKVNVDALGSSCQDTRRKLVTANADPSEEGSSAKSCESRSSRSNHHGYYYWFTTMIATMLGTASASNVVCSTNNIRLLKGSTDYTKSWHAHKQRCSDVDYKLILHVGLDSHVQMVATPVETKFDGSSDSLHVDGCHSVILQDTIQLNAEMRGKEAIVMDSQEMVDQLESEGLRLDRIGTVTYKWTHIATAFETAREGQPGAYDILRNCCASFVVDMMSYSGAPADVNALVNYFVERD